MKSRTFTKFSNCFLFSVIGLLVLFNPFIAKAQKTSTPAKLDYSNWQSVISFQDKTGYLITVEFSYFLTERGKAKVIIFSKMSGNQYQKEYDVASGDYINVPRPNSSISTIREEETGTYSQIGNSIRLEFPSHKVEAAITGIYASGDIFLNFGDKQKLEWTAEKIFGESNNLSSPRKIRKQSNSVESPEDVLDRLAAEYRNKKSGLGGVRSPEYILKNSSSARLKLGIYDFRAKEVLHIKSSGTASESDIRAKISIQILDDESNIHAELIRYGEKRQLKGKLDANGNLQLEGSYFDKIRWNFTLKAMVQNDKIVDGFYLINSNESSIEVKGKFDIAEWKENF